jgi:hypothetical protein
MLRFAGSSLRPRARGGWQRRAEMWDAIMLAVAVAFFAVAITYASGLDRL